MSTKLIDLKFYNWYWNFFNSARVVTNGNSDSIIWFKNTANLFFYLCETQILKELNLQFYWVHLLGFFLAYPMCDWSYVIKPLKDYPYLNIHAPFDRNLVIYLLKHVFSFWIVLPDALCTLKIHYPHFNIPFDNNEFVYLDAWITILPIMEELLIHLVQTFEPLNTSLETDFYVTPSIVVIGFIEKQSVTWPDRSERCIRIMPPISEKEGLPIKEHLEDYYFNNKATSNTFIDIIELYLEARPSLKESVLKVFNKDKILGKSIPENLAKYFICNFLTKDLTEYMQRFMVANLNLNDKNPSYTLRDLLIKKWDAYPVEARAQYLLNYRRELKKHISKLDEKGYPKEIAEKIKEALKHY